MTTLQFETYMVQRTQILEDEIAAFADRSDEYAAPSQLAAAFATASPAVADEYTTDEIIAASESHFYG